MTMIMHRCVWLFFFLGYTTLTAQHPWDRIDLIGETAKVIQFHPRFTLEIAGIFPLKRPAELQIDPVKLNQELTDPAVFEQLLEKLGGEYVVGELSGPTTTPFRITGRIQPMPGLKAGMRMGKSWELQTGISLFRVNWSGEFPVSVYPINGDPPFIEYGKLTATSEGLVGDLSVTRFLTRTSFQPFARAGIRGQFPTDHRSHASVRGVRVNRQGSPVARSVRPFGSIGIRFIPAPHFLIDICTSFSRLPGMTQAWSAEIASGLLF